MRWPQQETRKTTVFLISSRLIDKQAACFELSTFQNIFWFRRNGLIRRLPSAF